MDKASSDFEKLKQPDLLIHCTKDFQEIRSHLLNLCLKSLSINLIIYTKFPDDIYDIVHSLFKSSNSIENYPEWEIPLPNKFWTTCFHFEILIYLNHILTFIDLFFLLSMHVIGVMRRLAQNFISSIIFFFLFSKNDGHYADADRMDNRYFCVVSFKKDHIRCNAISMFCSIRNNRRWVESVILSHNSNHTNTVFSIYTISKSICMARLHSNSQNNTHASNYVIGYGIDPPYFSTEIKAREPKMIVRFNSKKALRQFSSCLCRKILLHNYMRVIPLLRSQVGGHGMIGVTVMLNVVLETNIKCEVVHMGLINALNVESINEKSLQNVKFCTSTTNNVQSETVRLLSGKKKNKAAHALNKNGPQGHREQGELKTIDILQFLTSDRLEHLHQHAGVYQLDEHTQKINTNEIRFRSTIYADRASIIQNIMDTNELFTDYSSHLVYSTISIQALAEMRTGDLSHQLNICKRLSLNRNKVTGDVKVFNTLRANNNCCSFVGNMSAVFIQRLNQFFVMLQYDRFLRFCTIQEKHVSNGSV
ncbi:hypothetical protein A3Q56_00705 [Intoshia linei]|uniref:Uncharacterized protein n=1 Tax=Intoshia linei TaxID=1819745 RepID=A0A177BDB7_9BILA|nr:hypothetical protein A3Q56_00705 [Intoshia linei]